MTRAALAQATERLTAHGLPYSTLFDRGYLVIVRDGERRLELRSLAEVKKLTTKRKGAR